MTTKFMLEGSVLEIRQDYIDVSTMGCTVRDEKWRVSDGAGHEHYYGEDGSTPTLDAVTEPSYRCPDCHDDHEGGTHFECKLCREEVRPGTRFEAPAMKRIAGRVEYLLDGEPVTYEQAFAAAAAAGLTSEGL